MRIVVDLTPLLPGGENGGAKPMVLSLLKHLVIARPNWSFVLLTTEITHEELAFLEGPRVERLRVIGGYGGADAPRPWPYRILRRGYYRARRVLPERWVRRLKRWYYRWRWTPGGRWFRRTLLEELGADLLFVPFTAPFFYDPRVPSVAVVYDLQYIEYPAFFAPEERAHRHRSVSDAVRLATHIVTISEFVRQTVLERFPISPERVTALPIGLPRPLPQLSELKARAWLRDQGLRPGQYFLCPANFWPHKNHEALFVAFRLLRERLPDAEVHLVLTGALEHRRRFLMQAAQQMGLRPWVKFPGFLPEAHLGTLFAHALALVFPSLYEGFGIPVLEAMAIGVPVACSRVASLPEVAGDAALFFDPRSPEQIAEAMIRLRQDIHLRQDLIRKGRKQVHHFWGASELAERYAALFEKVVHQQIHIPQYELAPLTLDGWLSAQAFFLFPRAKGRRVLELDCELPAWMPFPVTLRVQRGGDEHVVAEQRLRPGERALLRLPLPAQQGHWRLLCFPPFRPQEWGVANDARELGLRCLGARVLVLPEKKIVWELR